MFTIFKLSVETDTSWDCFDRCVHRKAVLHQHIAELTIQTDKQKNLMHQLRQNYHCMHCDLNAVNIRIKELKRIIDEINNLRAIANTQLWKKKQYYQTIKNAFTIKIQQHENTQKRCWSVVKNVKNFLNVVSVNVVDRDEMIVMNNNYNETLNKILKYEKNRFWSFIVELYFIIEVVCN